ncbi:hypothetical protein AWH56_005905 [Anaerobacillus isosaccharinicus]|uniref:Type II toxin-antitoxin system RelE/ParE family toxin n=1 Tax=Anaerobacillus isosaccharinicus TaxID=1532552 RepID=A0A1S2LS58_9BACI|nr:hypothetical protein [Anaerobacillus isosaccharinicus]MBA5584441.1 hypothetical protein [Anaerobacillus isosaccharinicus]QOY37171.1 hypothetical protein AWH56_005905 [Anaerobacillus isosaccharinicus]
MRVQWRSSAIKSLLELDNWRASLELPSIAGYLKNTIHSYFEQQDFSVYIPGRHVLIRNLPVDLRMVLISVGKSDPYKVFYRIVDNSIEIFLIRHPNQRPL